MNLSELDPSKNEETQEAINEREMARRYANEVNRSINEHRQNDDRAAESDKKLSSLLEFEPETETDFAYNWDTAEERQVTIADEVISLDDFVGFVDNEIGEMPSQGWQPAEVKDTIQGNNINEIEEKYGLVKVKKGLEETLKAVDQGKGQLQERMEVEASIIGHQYGDAGDRRAGEILTQDTGAVDLLKEDQAINMVERNRSDILDRIESYEHRITAQVQHADNALAIYGEELKDTYNDAMRDLQGQLEQIAAFGEVYENAGEHDYQKLEGGNDKEQLHKERAEHEMLKRVDNVGQILEDVTELTEEYSQAVNTIKENAEHTREDFEPKSLEILEDMEETYDAVRTRKTDEGCIQYENMESYVNDITGGAYDSVGNGISALDNQISGRLESADPNDFESA